MSCNKELDLFICTTLSCLLALLDAVQQLCGCCPYFSGVMTFEPSYGVASIDLHMGGLARRAVEYIDQVTSVASRLSLHVISRIVQDTQQLDDNFQTPYAHTCPAPYGTYSRFIETVRYCTAVTKYRYGEARWSRDQASEPATSGD